MKIIVLICNDNLLNNLFAKYDECSKQIIKVDSFEQFNIIKSFKQYKTNIEKWIEENIRKYSYDIYDDSYYEDNISNVTLQNLLMNGLYKADEIDEIIQKNLKLISNEFRNKFIEYEKKAGDTKYIFIWNIAEEKINEILKNQ